jgi:hypothetical protein
MFVALVDQHARQAPWRRAAPGKLGPGADPDGLQLTPGLAHGAGLRDQPGRDREIPGAAGVAVEPGRGQVAAEPPAGEGLASASVPSGESLTAFSLLLFSLFLFWWPPSMRDR